jgi:hypothetical protein
MFGIFSAIIGTILSILIRLELASPGIQYLDGDNQLFNVIVTLHALIMIFFFVMPILIGGFGNEYYKKLNKMKLSLDGPFRPISHKVADYRKLYNNFSLKHLILKFFHTSLSLDNNTNKYLNSYLAGLIEGDGCISVSKDFRDKNNKINYPKITITFNKKDLPFAEFLKEKVTGGNIVILKNKNCINLQIQDLLNIIKIVNLINGYMRTPKIEALYRLIN